MAVNDDKAMSDKLSSLVSKINDLNTQIDDVGTSFKQKKNLLTKKMDAEIEERFGNGLSSNGIIVESKAGEITGKYGNNLLYSLKIGVNEGLLSKKLDRTITEYKFKYSFSARFPDNLSWSAIGSQTDEEKKIIEIHAMENYLERCKKAEEKLDSEGIQLEYTRMEKKESYSKIDVRGLLRLIGINEATL